MGDTSIGYRGADYPLAVNNSFMTRVQDASFDRDLGMRAVYEMGNDQPAGMDDGPNSFRCSFTWFPIDLSVERKLVTTNTNVSGTHYLNGTTCTVQSLTKGVIGCRVMGLDYSCDAEGELRASVRLEGTSWDADGTTPITASAPSGDGAKRAKVVHVELGTYQAVRAQSFRLSYNASNVKMYQLASDDPVGTVNERPEVTLEVTWYESTSMSANQDFALASPTSCEIQIGQTWDTVGNIKHICTNMVSEGDGERGTVNGWATLTKRYRSKSDATYYGLVSSIIAA